VPLPQRWSCFRRCLSLSSPSYVSFLQMALFCVLSFSSRCKPVSGPVHEGAVGDTLGGAVDCRHPARGRGQAPHRTTVRIQSPGRNTRESLPKFKSHQNAYQRGQSSPLPHETTLAVVLILLLHTYTRRTNPHIAPTKQRKTGPGAGKRLWDGQRQEVGCP